MLKKKNERPITLSVPGGESQYTILAPCASQAAINSTSTIHVCGDMNEWYPNLWQKNPVALLVK